MLDSNLPIYYFKPSTDKTRTHEYDLLFTQFDSDPEPRYIVRHPDPSQPISKNIYAAAIVDAYVPDICFGEVLVKPAWSQPTLSAEEIRKNGGMAPPPVPLVPQDFAVQLYDPEQQVVILEQPGGFAGTPSYAFSVPQTTFRQPSASALDKSQHDPVADVTTPKLHFAWKREGKFSRDLICSLTGRSTDNASKKKGGKEPNVPVAIFTNNFRDLQIYESNLQRFELEDSKGFEIVLLLGAAVIRDIYIGQKKDPFNIGEAPRKSSSGLGRLKASPGLNASTVSGFDIPVTQSPPRISMDGRPPPPRPSLDGRTPPARGRGYSYPTPPPDPRAAWELENEAARLRVQQDTERKMAERQRKEQERRDQEEAKRIQKLMDSEARARQREQARRQADIDRETERLKREFGDQSKLFPPLPMRPNDRHSLSGPGLGSGSTGGYNMPGAFPPPTPPAMNPHGRPQQGPYMQVSGPGHRPTASQSSFFHSHTSNQNGGLNAPQMKPKRSFFGLRSASNEDEGKQRLQRKKSNHW